MPNVNELEEINESPRRKSKNLSKNLLNQSKFKQ